MTLLFVRCVLPLLLVAAPAQAAEPVPPPPAAAPAPPPMPPPAPPPPAEPEPEVLLQKGARVGGWGAPVVEIGPVRDRAAVFVGGRGGLLVNGRFTIGGGGMGLANRIAAPAGSGRPGEDLDLKMGYGGGWLEWTFRPVKLVHLSVGVLLGGGELSLAFRHGGSYGSGNDGIFVAEPAVVAEVNVAKHVRANLGATWRLVGGVDLPGVSSSDVSGPAGVIALKFGKF